MAFISFNVMSVSPSSFLFLLDLRQFMADEDQIIVLFSLDGLEPSVLEPTHADVDIRVLGLLRMIFEELRRCRGHVDRDGRLDVLVRLFSVLIALVLDVSPESGLRVILEVSEQCYDLFHWNNSIM